MCRVIVAGGRNVLESDHNIRTAAIELLRLKATEVVSGCCHGADACGELAAARLGLIVRLKPADWRRHGKAAGPIRNKEMAKIADACILFPGGSGTASMRAEAEANGLEIVNIERAQMKAKNPKGAK